MIEVVESLKNNQILYSQNVIDLKTCIHEKYPHYDTRLAAIQFAGAVHKIIDQNVLCFDKPLQVTIKNNLLQEVIKKEVFDINAYDIFKACTALDISDEHYFESLTTWVNNNQNHHFSKEQVVELKAKLNDVQQPLKILTPSEDKLAALPPHTYVFNIINILKNRTSLVLIAVMMTLGTVVLSKNLSHGSNTHKNITNTPIETMFDTEEENILLTPIHPSTPQTDSNNALHKSLQHKEINTDALYNFLTKRDSTLADQPYFNSILDVAREFNINPLLMFAITGQEQSFVPKSNINATLIANNPFNVYGSWKRFNTDIDDASRIVARTILNLSKGCPENEDPLKWINKKYAEDPNWHLGVGQILATLEETAGD